MVATSGHRLIEEETIAMMIEKLFPLADLITPNMDEAGILAHLKVETVDVMYRAGERILALGCKRVLVKGGHLDRDLLQSILFESNKAPQIFESKKIKTRNTHGSGCTLSSAIAAYLAQGKTVSEAVSLGQHYVFTAIENGADVQLGMGNGPLNHFFNPCKQIKYELIK
jgi:hydroxymethylpyrimidine/phosphomethylpyrimidine kinase